MNPLKQLIPSDICLRCQVCCRFPDPDSEMFPLFTKEERNRLSPKERAFFAPTAEIPLKPAAKSFPDGDGTRCACPFFNVTTQECAIYTSRPLDCQLYPFVLTFSPTRKRIFVGIDTQCPFIQEAANQEALLSYEAEIRSFLEAGKTVESVLQNPKLIGEGEETTLPLFPLSGLTERLCHETLFGDPPSPAKGLSLLSLNDKEIIGHAFSTSPRTFAEESFVALFVFSDLLRIYWKKEGDLLFLIAEQGNRFFMPVPPVARKRRAEDFERGFALLRDLNAEGAPLRIEGFPEEERPLLHALGCDDYAKPPEYLYRRENLVALRGNAYKSKRALANYFVKRFDYTCLPYRREDFWGCLRLFRIWQEAKLSKTEDPYEKALLEDAAFVHRRALAHAGELGLDGRVVKIGGEIKGYTFGYPLNERIFCVLLEIADPAVKGLPQFLFREFCREKAAWEWVSAMDDSGLERLRRVKTSYRPALKQVPYAAVRKREAVRKAV